MLSIKSAALQNAADGQRRGVPRSARHRALARGCVTVRHVAALQLAIDTANDSFRHRVRRRQYRQIDLQHGAEDVVMAMQGGQ